VCEADADVVALQEVTPTFLRALLDDARVRARYVLSDDHNARTLDPDGVLVLSRLPVRQVVEDSIREQVIGQDTIYRVALDGQPAGASLTVTASREALTIVSVVPAGRSSALGW
jgi:endonuclease/exonuclease/phosphatase family metal-dependent hydrolase